MLNEQNQNLVSQIANLFCTDALCRSSLISRFNVYLTDNLFESILSTLNRGRFYYCTFTNVVHNQNSITIFFRYNDLFSNAQGDGKIQDLPLNKAGDLNAIFAKGDLTYIGSKSINNQTVFIIKNNNIPGYGIALTQQNVNNPNPSGQSGDGGANIIVEPSGSSINTKTVPLISKENISTYDFNSLIMPALLIGGFFLLKNKF